MFVSWPATQMAVAYLLLASWALSGCKFARRNERFVVLRLGRVHGVRGPGFTFIFVPLERALRVDLAEKRLPLGERAYTTSEGRKIRYNGLLAWRIVDPVQSVTQLQTVQHAVRSTAEKWLEAQSSAGTYGDLASGRRGLEQNLAANLGREFPSWGIELSVCRIEDIESM